MKARSKTLEKPKSRDSGIELMRILAMLCIVGFHILFSPGFNNLPAPAAEAYVAVQPNCIKKFFYLFVLGSGGWIGNTAFFTISAWFLLDRLPSMKSSLRRVWILEKEVLFWAILLCLLGAYLENQGLVSLSEYNRVGFVFPLSTGLWWYATSYALFLLFLPFLYVGLQKMGKKLHLSLVLIVLVIWGVGSLIPDVKFDLNAPSVFVMIYIFLIVSYYKWYMKPFSTKICWLLIAVGVGINLLYYVIPIIYSHIKGTDSNNSTPFVFVVEHWSISQLMIGFGLFLLFERLHFRNKVINLIASSTFGVYLISQHPVVTKFVWSYVLSFLKMYASRFAVIEVVAVTLGLFCVGAVTDLLIRRMLFSFLFKKKSKGRLFDRVWALAFRTFSPFYQKIMNL
ncbi:MAG: acyltransferase [Bifidobacterium sp.]|nr:acyltransferase [Bifidobacterium sp.]